MFWYVVTMLQEQTKTLFVYTLPNILIGEICIKFKIQGESNFFVSQFVDYKNLFTQSLNILQIPRMTYQVNYKPLRVKN